MVSVYLPGVRNGYPIDIPEDYLGEVITPTRPHGDADPVAAIRAALLRPIGTPCLEQLVHPGNQVAVIIDDITRETPAGVNRTVAEADFRIGIGMIMPHLDAGYGGGAKIVLPGVCGQATVDAFHSQMADIDTNQLGLENAALRLDLEQIVGECVRLDFILNVILDNRGNLSRCVAGDATRAHRTGTRFAREVYGVPVKRRYPLVITSAYPHQIDFWQSTKALASGEILTQSGGMLILVTECPEGHGNHPLFADYIGMDLDDLLHRFDGGGVADRCAAAEAVAVCRMKRRIRIGLVSSGLSADEVRKMGLMDYSSVETAIAEAIGPMQEKKIGLLTHGGATLPRLPD